MISIVIPVRNSEYRLEQCLAALRQQSLSPDQYEILVVDDGSVDASSEVARAGGARVVRQGARGAASARNRGIREASGELVLFTDADCLADSHWAERLSREIIQNGIAGAVGRCCSSQDNWVAALIQIELDQRYARMATQASIDFLNTGNCGFRRELLLENLFDENFRWLEDVELSFRLTQLGCSVAFVPDAVVSHPHPESFWLYLKRKFNYASYAPAIYKRFPNKALSDSRTPLTRRFQILLLGSSLPVLLWSRIAGLLLIGGSLALSLPLIHRAYQKSPRFGILAPLYVLCGNAAFIAGSLWGIMRRGSSQSSA